MIRKDDGKLAKSVDEICKRKRCAGRQKIR
jgi:hypothetical protein